MTSIDSFGFADCWHLTDITLPSSVKSIDWYAFYACRSLTDIVIPNNVITIGYRAFDGCESLASITLPNALTVIEDEAFAGCRRLVSVCNNSDLTLTIGSDAHGGVAYHAWMIVDKYGNKTYGDPPLGMEYTATEDGFLFEKENGEYRLIAYLGTEDSVTLPAGINGNSYKIQGLQGVRNVILPAGMTSIDAYAFSNCTDLISVVIPDGVTSIGDHAFQNCGQLTAVKIPDSVTSIGYLAFEGCERLGSINVPAGLTDVDFSECGGITSITFTKGVTSISLVNCSRLTSLEIPDGVEAVNLSGCSSLVSFTIPGKVTSIGGCAFMDCHNLAGITIPSSVASIGERAFLDTALYNDPSNWEDGLLVIDGCLIDVKENVDRIMRKDIRLIADRALEECYRLHTMTICGESFWTLGTLTNLETLIITDLPQSIANYFGGSVSALPMTLKNIVLADGVKMHDTAFCDLSGNPITGVTVFVEETEQDTMWEENFPGWNAGNRVVYGDNWVYADFYGANGTFAGGGIFRTSQVIRMPYIKDYTDGVYRYVFEGFDLDGDGVVDAIPATSRVDIAAQAIFTASCLHTSSSWVVEQAPTCMADGYGYRVCDHCGEKLEKKTIAAKGHTLGDWVLTAQPTCTEQGKETRFCACGHSETRSVPALGHTFGEYISNNDATAEADGTKTAVCERCEATDTMVDEGSAFGYAGKFEEAVAALNAGDPADRHYTALREALLLWKSLSEEEKAEVAEAYAALSAMVDAYNAKAETANQAMEDATEIAFAPLIGSFAFLAALWEILKKRLYL